MHHAEYISQQKLKTRCHNIQNKQLVHNDRFPILPHQKESYMHSDHDIFYGFPSYNDLVHGQHGMQL